MKLMLINKSTDQLSLDFTDNVVSVSYFSIFNTDTFESDSISMSFSKKVFNDAINQDTDMFVIKEMDNLMMFKINNNDNFDLSLERVGKSFHIKGIEYSFDKIKRGS